MCSGGPPAVTAEASYGLAGALDRRGRSGLNWVDDDLVIGEAAFVGRHVGSFAGISPTGVSIALPFVVFTRFRSGLLTGERFVYDLNGLLRQLGQPYFEARQT